LRHLKKKVGGSTYNEEFKVVVRSIRDVLDIGPASPQHHPMATFNINAVDGKAEYVPQVQSPSPEERNNNYNASSPAKQVEGYAFPSDENET